MMAWLRSKEETWTVGVHIAEPKLFGGESLLLSEKGRKNQIKRDPEFESSEYRI